MKKFSFYDILLAEGIGKMKKIIWIFGEPGVGTKSLVRRILNNQDCIKDFFGINDSNILYANVSEDYNNLLSISDSSLERLPIIFKYISDLLERHLVICQEVK